MLTVEIQLKKLGRTHASYLQHGQPFYQSLKMPDISTLLCIVITLFFFTIPSPFLYSVPRYPRFTEWNVKDNHLPEHNLADKSAAMLKQGGIFNRLIRFIKLFVRDL